ncbi:MAG: hypothetical protein JXL80_18250 [Planctomycetes bacterium]|nr:hypothetical protein [Planctomycetota bacterium]
MQWLVTILAALVQVFLPALVEAMKRKAEDARPQPALRDRLRARVRERWVTP